MNTRKNKQIELYKVYSWEVESIGQYGCYPTLEQALIEKSEAAQALGANEDELTLSSDMCKEETLRNENMYEILEYHGLNV